MADQLLPVSSGSAGFNGTVRSESLSNLNQSDSDAPGGFSQVLAGEYSDPSATEGQPATPVEGQAADGSGAQALPTDGKELPDAAVAAALGEAGVLEEAEAPLVLAAANLDAEAQAPAADADSLDPALMAQLPGLEPVAADAVEAQPLAATMMNLAVTDDGPAGSVAVTGLAVNADGSASRRPATVTPILPALTPVGEDDAVLEPLPTPLSNNSDRLISNAVQAALAERKMMEGRQAGTQVKTELAAEGPDLGLLSRTDNSPATSAAPAGNATTIPLANASGSFGTSVIQVPVRQAGWDQALGDRVQWMMSQKLQGAELKLNPANLGPLEVRINVQNEQATVMFAAQQGVVREAIEQAVPKLREMLGESGIELLNVDVSEQSFAEQRRETGDGRFAAGDALGGSDEAALAEPEQVAPTVTFTSRPGGIDFFA